MGEADDAYLLQIVDEGRKSILELEGTAID